jgi:hypothetical protein
MPVVWLGVFLFIIAIVALSQIAKYSERQLALLREIRDLLQGTQGSATRGQV